MSRVEYINSLIKELNNKTLKTKTNIQKYRSVFALNRNVAGFNTKLKDLIFTLVFSKMKGAYIWDLDNNKYIDISMGFGTHLFGHSPMDITNNLKKQLDVGIGLGPITELAGQTAEQISRLTNVERVAFFNSGTEAVMVALRIARSYTKKNKVVIFKNSYHGTFDPILTIRNNRENNVGIESIPGIHNDLLKDTYLLDYGTNESIEFIKSHHGQLAAILIEPVQSRNMELQPFDYLKRLRSITEKLNIALIFDEMVTGFRIAPGGMQEVIGIQSDIVTYGKIVGGGMPIGIVAGKRKYLDMLDGGFWNYNDDSSPKLNMTFVAGTFCHHPLSMKASLTILKKIEKNKHIYKELNSKTDEFCKNINSQLKSLNSEIELVNYGSMFRFNLKGVNKLLYYELLKNGVYIWEGRSCFFSTEHDEQVIKELTEIIIKSVKNLPNRNT